MAGADIVIVAGMAAGMLGASSIVAWLLAGIIAAIMAVTVAKAATLYPMVTGPHGYASAAFGHLWGFLSGWAFWLGTALITAVFASAAIFYLGMFVQIGTLVGAALKVMIVAAITGLAILSFDRKLPAWSTAVKLLLPAAIIIGGMVALVSRPEVFISNYANILPVGIAQLPIALGLMLWAFAGFELPLFKRTRPEEKKLELAAVGAVALLTIFFLVINAFVYGIVPSTRLGYSPVPIIPALSELLGGVAGGVLVSILGLVALFTLFAPREAGTWGAGEIACGMAADGMAPRFFGELHQTARTPHCAFILQGVVAAVAAAIFGPANLIWISVTCLLIGWASIAVAYLRLRVYYYRTPYSRLPLEILPIIAVVVTVWLLYSVPVIPLLVALLLFAIGPVFYVHYAPCKECSKIKDRMLSESNAESRNSFLADSYLGWLFRFLEGDRK